MPERRTKTQREYIPKYIKGRVYESQNRICAHCGKADGMDYHPYHIISNHRRTLLLFAVIDMVSAGKRPIQERRRLQWQTTNIS